MKVTSGTVEEVRKQQQENNHDDVQFDVGIFFGCGPETEDLIHHLLFDAPGG